MLTKNVLPTKHLNGGLPKIEGTNLANLVFIFLIPCAIVFEFVLIGRIFASEIVLMAVAAFHITKSGFTKLLSVKFLRTVLILALMWLGSQIVTDVFRDIYFEDWSRGWAKILVFITNCVGLYFLVGRSRKNFITFGYGLAAGYILIFIIDPNEYAQGNSWKWGYGASVTYLCILLSMSPLVRKVPYVQEVTLALLAMINVFLDFRSLGANCFIVLLYIIVSRVLLEGKAKSSELGLFAIFMIVLFGFFAIASYEYAAVQGWLGEAAWEKHYSQASGDFGLLLGGRSEILGSFPAIVDSPIIGHGSWARNIEYVYIMLDRQAEMGYGLNTAYYGNDLIPTHSYIFGSWVEAGLMGAVFWSIILVRTVRALIDMTRSSDPALPWFGFLFFDLIWSIFFSPFGALSRLTTAYGIVAIIIIFQEEREAKKVPQQRTGVGR